MTRKRPARTGNPDLRQQNSNATSFSPWEKLREQVEKPAQCSWLPNLRSFKVKLPVRCYISQLNEAQNILRSSRWASISERSRHTVRNFLLADICNWSLMWGDPG